MPVKHLKRVDLQTNTVCLEMVRLDDTTKDIKKVRCLPCLRIVSAEAVKAEREAAKVVRTIAPILRRELDKQGKELL